MKHPPLLLLALFSAPLFFDAANAQTTTAVCQSDVTGSFGVAMGKVVKVGNTLAFVDEGDMKTSFSIDGSNIRSVNDGASTFTVFTKSPVLYRGKGRTEFQFRLSHGNCEPIARWLRNRQSRTRGAAPPRKEASPSSAPKTYMVIHKQWRGGGDAAGRLTVSAKTVKFECFEYPNRSHEWLRRNIRDAEIKQDAPNTLVLIPYQGRKYTLEFQDLTPVQTRAVRASILRLP